MKKKNGIHAIIKIDIVREPKGFHKNPSPKTRVFALRSPI